MTPCERCAPRSPRWIARSRPRLAAPAPAFHSRVLPGDDMKPTFLDRAIGLFSPRAELDRLRARSAVQMLRGYDAARQKKRDGGWVAQGSSANAEIGPALARLRNASREMVRNNAYASRIVDVLVAHDVGAGIVARPKKGKKALDKRLAEAWRAWAETPECDAEGQLDLYGLQSLVRRTIAESGECCECWT
jgi:capsid protein